MVCGKVQFILTVCTSKAVVVVPEGVVVMAVKFIIAVTDAKLL